MTYKKKIYVAIFMIFSIIVVSSYSQEISAQEQAVPSWVKDIAVWWGEEKISDEDFINTFQYLVENKIIKLPTPVNIEPECGIGLVLNTTSNECVIHDGSENTGIFVEALHEQRKTIVSLIKTTTFWWGEGKIADQDFIDALQYLVENNVLTIEKPIKQPLVQIELKPKLENLNLWPKIDRIEDFAVQGHKNIDLYNFQFKLVDAKRKSLTPDGTISIVLLDDRNRILYLDAFSIRKANYQDSFDAFEGTESDKIYSWEIKTSDIRSGFTPYGKAKLAFTDKFGLKFFSEYDKVSIPQFG